MKRIIGCLLVSSSVMADIANKETLTVPTNKTEFAVTLPANPTTGFQWSIVSYDKNLLTLKSYNYQNPHTNLVGAGGLMTFTFSLNKGKLYPNKANMIFKYARSWEPGSATLKNVVIHFVAEQ